MPTPAYAFCDVAVVWGRQLARQDVTLPFARQVQDTYTNRRLIAARVQRPPVSSWSITSKISKHWHFETLRCRFECTLTSTQARLDRRIEQEREATATQTTRLKTYYGKSPSFALCGLPRRHVSLFFKASAD